MRRVRYVVAASVDGYIAGPNGETDWIIMDPGIDFGALFAEFDTFLLGRRTFEAMAGQRGPATPGIKTVVFSRTLQPDKYPDVTIVAGKLDETIAAMRATSGKDIWLFGGGSLFRSLLDARLVDTVEIAFMPVVLGGGIPLLSSPARRTKLKLTGHKVYPTGIVSLQYAVVNG